MRQAQQVSSTSPIDKPNPALERLRADVTELLSSSTWKEALKFKTRFHSYSFNNALLIYLQRPDATLVAGYRRWQGLGRQVKKGETSLAILAPIVRRDEDEPRVVGFRTARVFDISQTEGEPIPVSPQPVILEQDNSQLGGLLAQAEALAAARGFSVKEQALSRALGRYNRWDKTIVLRNDLPPLQRLKTLVHELAHALMHGEQAENEQRHLLELEAESCAFLVLHDLGFDTSRYSFPYLASWTERPDELLVAGEKAAKVAGVVLADLKPSPEPA